MTIKDLTKVWTTLVFEKVVVTTQNNMEVEILFKGTMEELGKQTHLKDKEVKELFNTGTDDEGQIVFFLYV